MFLAPQQALVQTVPQNISRGESSQFRISRIDVHNGERSNGERDDSKRKEGDRHSVLEGGFLCGGRRLHSTPWVCEIYLALSETSSACRNVMVDVTEDRDGTM